MRIRMQKLIGLRLPDPVFDFVEGLANERDRTPTQVVVGAILGGGSGWRWLVAAKGDFLFPHPP